MLAQGGPLLLVLDDLHWANRRTLLLLRHIVRSAQTSPLAVLGTYRDDGEPGPANGLTELLVELRRDHRLDRLTLAGFDEPQTAASIAAQRPEGIDPTLLRGLHHATGGNPFLIGEVLHELAADAGGDQLPVPETVHGMLRRRLKRLGAQACEVLVAAAVIGPEFRLDLLEALFPTRPAAVLGALERALAARIVVEVPGDDDRYAFSPPLLHQAIYAIPSAARRRRLHRRVDDLGRGEPAHPALEGIEGNPRARADRPRRPAALRRPWASDGQRTARALTAP